MSIHLFHFCNFFWGWVAAGRDWTCFPAAGRAVCLAMPLLPRSASCAICAALLFAACPAALRAQAPAAKVAEVTSFEDVTARLDRGGSVYLYLSTAQWLEGLAQTVAGFREVADASVASPGERQEMGRWFDLGIDVIKKSGVEQISGFGMSSIAVEPGLYRNITFLHHSRGKAAGLLHDLAGVAPHALTTLDLLPADTAMAGFTDFNLELLVNFLRSESSSLPEAQSGIEAGLAQFTLLAGMPLETALQSLGGEAGLVLTLDRARVVELPAVVAPAPPTIPVPRLALVLETRNDQIFQRVDQAMGGFPGVIKIDEGTLHMRTMTYPVSAKFTVRATLAQTEKYLILATDDSLVRDMLAAQKSGRGWKSTPEFQKMAAGLPAEGNGFSVGSQFFAEAYTKFRRDMLKSSARSTPGEDAIAQKLLNSQTIPSSYTVSSHVEDGWLTVSKSSQSMTQMVAPLVLLPVAAMSANAAIPFFNKPHAVDPVPLSPPAKRGRGPKGAPKHEP